MLLTTIPGINEMRQFVLSGHANACRSPNKGEVYGWILKLLVDCRYRTLLRRDKGTVKQYICLVTGYSRAQVTRLITQYRQNGTIRLEPANSRNQFARIYQPEDIVLLAEIDNAHDRLSGKAARKLCERAYAVFDDERYERLCRISVSHIYNLRDSAAYRSVGRTFTKTQATTTAIGERRKPRPEGKPGFIRVDTVHQGDQDGEKGVYHINLVDEMTQWEIVVAVERISERYMLPALEAALAQFPFVLQEFHADNGSEYINKQVAHLLERLLVKLSKSRAYHSGDNGLVESKNGSVIRKALGYGHMPGKAAPLINAWYEEWFVPYLNFHRPCGYRQTTIDPETGRRTHRYPADGYMMPYEKLESLENSEQYLKPGVTFDQIHQQAYAMSDTDWAIAMMEAKYRMLEGVADNKT